MNWKVGDRAMIWADNPKNHAECVGTYCTIISLSSTQSGQFSILADGAPTNDPRGWSIKPKYLRPIYDGMELSIWEDCVFKPKEFVT